MGEKTQVAQSQHMATRQGVLISKIVISPLCQADHRSYFRYGRVILWPRLTLAHTSHFDLTQNLNECEKIN